ncbi:MAG: alpha/beta hydrolase, partial [Flavobacterium sp.]
MKVAILLIFVFIGLPIHAQEITPKTLAIGEIRTIESTILKESRTLNVYLPSGYDHHKAYPVMYVLDGGIDEDFLHITGLVQFFTMTFDMPDHIVVGIANIDRKRDFTFHTDAADLKKEFPTAGQSDEFIRFIETELLPFVESRYKTTATKYILGQSLGGLLATEILLKKPQLFTNYLIVSPSLWWDNDSLINNAKAMLSNQSSAIEYVYIAVGADEDKRMISHAKKLSELIQKDKRRKIRTDYIKM